MNESTIILIVNSLLYILTFAVYQKRIKTFQLGSFVLLFYSLISIGSIFLYNIDSIWTFEEITVFPLFYLYLILMISFYPVLNFSNKKVSDIKMPDEIAMNIISIIVIIVYLCFFFQTILSNFSLSSLFDPATLVENYETKTENIGYDDGNINIFGILKNFFNSILWILFMYNWIQKKKVLAIGVFAAIIISVFTSLAWGARGPLMFIILQIPFVYLVFSPLMTQKMRKQYIFTVTGFIIFIFVGGAALTIGRFDDAANFTIIDIVLYYASSNFIKFDNFVLDVGGCRYGDRVFPLIRLLLGLDTAGDYKTRRMLYPNLKIDDSQFTFFVGEFVIDFGPVLAFLIISFFAVIFFKKLSSKKYDLGTVLLLSLAYNIIVVGFTLFPYSELGGNISILYIIFWIFVFKYFTSKRLVIGKK
ncbi:O-antigen polymerase [uncultured Bacteroides sp.]|uniref:O-antigen polymerase n=1 Tax=uncultured Bacteroides sp. TaxID=162156 RepID=UPI0025E9A4F7|nr:O-antigen polymerase [uncultured Bacteroides sp.]